MMAHLLRALARLDDHWIGDLIAVCRLWAGGYGLMILGYGLGLK